ncbi:sugar-binding domain-containing protein [Caecibacteroides pullorum]|uniref:Beta-glucuronidase n=1 Tax=Caecibacteroides pullorum TaxID=2725562 RepID=A0AA40ZQ33_9BACT|nr:sugar-binding domain-containing protein [Caecibacteroides pullorum]MBM6856075.1 beta-glucuronidase [Caecibacteroides pullorum]MBV8057082.1 beta-glucuronidase [Caecibacteroides pullorum]
MKKGLLYPLLSAALWMTASGLNAQTQEVDLSGTWGFQTDFMDFRRGSLDVRYMHRLQDTIVLPAITDDYQIGWKSPYCHIDRLTRKYEYMGPAWYQREIAFPKEWAGKRIFMYFERTHWLSSIFVDTKEVSKLDYISVPHCHELTDFVKPGKTHLITLCIDNRYQYDTHKWNHAHTEFTQINWNGILGEMKLIAVDPVYVDDMQLYPDVTEKTVTARLQIRNYTGKPFEGTARFHITGDDGYNLTRELPVNGKDSLVSFEGKIALGKDIQLWDEFHPNLYRVECKLLTSVGETNYEHEKEVTFGMREVAQGKNHVLVNGHPIHLRGTVENAVFPKTGYAPVDDASWERIFRILKDYGMNHMRFHSWCPPAAAFRMADKLGVYLQVELPMWGKDGEPGEPARWDFFRREQKAILKEYGNHPSFILYCNGNEISGDFDFIEELTRYGREHDSRHLFSGSTARKRVASDQFYTTHQTTSGGATVYEGRPYTDWDICKGTNIDVPVISHETGQRCVYPDYSIIAKFDGPVEARNLEKFRSQLEANGMGDQADDFFRASGAQTVFEYKDVIEAQLRTSTSAGFQLLSINDLPEQGYAPVGILDPFWDSKGLITPEEFRHFCSPTVPLLRFEKRVWNGGETFEAVAEVYNFSDRSLKNSKVSWQLLDEQGKTLRQGKLKTQTFLCDTVIRAGSFSCILPEGSEPQKLTVQLLVGKDYVNSWDIWVYPKTGQLMQSTADVLYTTTFDAVAKQQLQAGKKVVLLPNPKQVKGRRSSFHNHFWNPIMFKWAPMTLGWLIHDDSPVFDHFVTENHPDWQWWDILNYAKVIELQETPQALRPFIQTIDSYDSNRKLGIGFEARVGGGKLLVLALDTQKDMDKRPATCQLLESIDRYVKSEKFNPQVELDTAFIDSFLTTKQTFKK